MSGSVLFSSRKTYLNQYVGLLSTHSVDCAGYPFGSIVPFCRDYAYQPVFLISRLAQHTINIQKNPKISLLVSDVADIGFADVQTCSRLTIIGRAEPVSEPDTIERYYRHYRDAHNYHEQLDFDFYRLVPEKVRFIAGFGKIHWVEPQPLFCSHPFTAEEEVDILNHMNRDHADALQRYCRQRQLEPPVDLPLDMVGIDAFGFELRIGHKLLRFAFEQPVASPGQVRKALIAKLQEASNG